MHARVIAGPPEPRATRTSEAAERRGGTVSAQNAVVMTNGTLDWDRSRRPERGPLPADWLDYRGYHDGEHGQEQRSDAGALVRIQHGDGELGDLRRLPQPHKPADAEPRPLRVGKVQHAPGDVVVPVDVGEVPELSVAQHGDGAEKTEAPRLGRKLAEPLRQPLAVGRHDRPERHRASVGERHVEDGRIGHGSEAGR